MGDFNSAWFIAGAIGFILLAIDILIPEAWRKRIGWLLLSFGLVLFIVGAGGLAFDLYKKFTKPEASQSSASPAPVTTPPPVTVSPETIAFWGLTGSTYTFTVRSLSDVDLYSVVVKVGVESKSLRVGKDFEIRVPKESVHLIYDGKEGQLFDPVILDVIDNPPSQFSGAWVLMYRLKAHEAREITLKRIKASDEVSASASILGFDPVPQPLIAEHGKVKFRFLDKYIEEGIVPLPHKKHRTGEDVTTGSHGDWLIGSEEQDYWKSELRRFSKAEAWVVASPQDVVAHNLGTELDAIFRAAKWSSMLLPFSQKSEWELMTKYPRDGVVLIVPRRDAKVATLERLFKRSAIPFVVDENPTMTRTDGKQFTQNNEHFDGVIVAVGGKN